MPRHTSVFRFTTPHARNICLSITPELSGEVNFRSTTRACLEDEHTLVLTVEAEDTAALRAALNMALRLVNVADEMQQIT
ncbi:MAG TPA: KEOPS complex subunit Pcc1 [Methanoregula sp.]|nr:KEOPS complex subunit Pcc1 [Methanoregula sp.]